MNQITREQMLQVCKIRCSPRFYNPKKKETKEVFPAF